MWMFTAEAVSRLSTGEVWTSLISLSAVYVGLGIVELFVMRKYVLGGVDAVMPPSKPKQDNDSDEETLSFAY
jgi:cytochrome d ubiquinol oxidase subunit I